MAKAGACRLCGRGIEPHGRGGSPAYCKGCTAKADKKAARMPRVDCRECGKAFSTRLLTVRYCSDPCRSAAARRASVEGRRRYDADPEKLALKRARSRLAAAARRAKKRGDRPPRANRDIKGLRPNARSAEPYPCALCGSDFVPYGAGRPAYCKRCAAKADKEIGRERTLNCKECGKKFTTPNRIVKYCSTKCRAAGRRRISREGARKRMKDPEARAMAAARRRAWDAARRGGKKGRGASAARPTMAAALAVHPAPSSAAARRPSARSPAL